MSAPPIPPLPPGPITEPPPPLPPLPPQLQESAPHFDNPLVAPRPHRLDPDLPANVRRGVSHNINRILLFILDGSHVG